MKKGFRSPPRSDGGGCWRGEVARRVRGWCVYALAQAEQYSRAGPAFFRRVTTKKRQVFIPAPCVRPRLPPGFPPDADQPAVLLQVAVEHEARPVKPPHRPVLEHPRGAVVLQPLHDAAEEAVPQPVPAARLPSPVLSIRVLSIVISIVL